MFIDFLCKFLRYVTIASTITFADFVEQVPTYIAGTAVFSGDNLAVDDLAPASSLTTHNKITTILFPGKKNPIQMKLMYIFYIEPFNCKNKTESTYFLVELWTLSAQSTPIKPVNLGYRILYIVSCKLRTQF